MNDELEALELEASLLCIGVIEVIFDTQRHLIVRPYSLERLHAAAMIMSIKRCWFDHDHYDIPKRRVPWFEQAADDTEFFRKVRPREIVVELRRARG